MARSRGTIASSYAHIRSDHDVLARAVIADDVLVATIGSFTIGREREITEHIFRLDA